MKFPVFDLHCDTALSLIGEHGAPPRALHRNEGHIDLERASVLPGYCQCFACFTTPSMEQEYKKSIVEVFEKEMDTILSELHRNRDIIQQVYSADEIRENYKNGIMSALLTIEGPAGFGFNPEMLEYLYLAGFRITTLGWNEKNPLTGSHQTGGGLTDLGREFVKEAQRIGFVIDVSHISDEGFWDIMDITEKPVIATHSNSRFVWDVSRNLSDDMFREICNTGGVAGFNQYAGFIGDHPSVDDACRHFLHFVEIDPECKHIALGGDLDGCEALCDGFHGIESYPVLAQKLHEYGLSDGNLQSIFWDNALGVMDHCCI